MDKDTKIVEGRLKIYLNLMTRHAQVQNESTLNIFLINSIIDNLF